MKNNERITHRKIQVSHQYKEIHHPKVIFQNAQDSISKSIHKTIGGNSQARRPGAALYPDANSMMPCCDPTTRLDANSIIQHVLFHLPRSPTTRPGLEVKIHHFQFLLKHCKLKLAHFRFTLSRFSSWSSSFGNSFFFFQH